MQVDIPTHKPVNPKPTKVSSAGLARVGRHAAEFGGCAHRPLHLVDFGTYLGFGVEGLGLGVSVGFTERPGISVSGPEL